MIALLGRAAPFLAAALIAVVVAVWVLRGDFIEGLGTIGKPGGGPLNSLGDTVESLALSALGASAIVFAALVAVGAPLGVSRAIARRNRRCARLTIVPSQNEATPAQVQDLVEALHQRVEERWYRRLPHGQPSFSLEMRSTPDGDGPCELRIEVVCPQEMAATVEGAIRAPYPDARVEASQEAPETPPCLLRLHKRHSFIRRLRTPTEYEPPPVDAVLSQLSKLQAPACLQYVLTPVPAIFDILARALFQAQEGRLARKQRGPSGHPGLSSELAERELEGGLALQHNRLFFAEIRVGAQSGAEARDLASAVQARSGAENQLVERHMLAFRGRVGRAVGDLVPDLRRGVLSSAELTGLWQLPSPGLTGVSLARSSTPRAIAAPEVSRDPAHAVVRDEHGPVGLRPEERFAGVAITGAQGTGKSSVALRFIENDSAHRPEVAMVVLDPNQDLARKALGVIPRDRVVHYLDPLEPQFGLNPLTAPGHPATIADNMVGAVKDLYEEGDLHASSERFIHEATMAVVGAHRLGVLGATPSFWHLARMLHLEQRPFWKRIAAAIESEPAYFETSLYFGHTLPAQLDTAASAFAQRLEAPSNKLQVLLSGHLDRVFRHPRTLSLDDVVRNREVLVVNGRMGDFGARNARMLMQVVLNSLYGALRRQQELPESQRVKVALVVDEAHLILNPRFAEALATLRSAGLEVVAAWQYGEQVQDPVIRAGLMNLLGNRFVFRTSEVEEARELSRLMAATYSDQVRADPETRARVRFSPDALFGLETHKTGCTLIARRQRRATFVAETFETRSEPALRAHHLAAQTGRGGFVPDTWDHPFDDWHGAPTRRGQHDEDEADGGATEDLERETAELGRPTLAAASGDGAATAQTDGAASREKAPANLPAPPGRRPTAPPRPGPSAAEILEEHRRLYVDGGSKKPSATRYPPPSPSGRSGAKPKPRLWSDEDLRRSEERKRRAAEERERERARAEERSPRANRAAPGAGSEVEALRRRIAELEEELGARSEGKPAERLTDSEGDGAGEPHDQGGQGGLDTRTRARAGEPDGRGAGPPSAHPGSTDGAAVPESYTELDFNSPSGIEWDGSANQPKRIEPERRHLEALAALHRLSLAYGSQLGRLCWPGVSDTTRNNVLKAMFSAGWVDRGYIRERGIGGRPKRFYALSKAGFEVGKAYAGPRRPYIPDDATWKATRLEAFKNAIHDLHVAGWLVAFHAIVGRFVPDWYGEKHGLVVPQRPVKDKWRRIELDDVEKTLGAEARGVRNLKLDHFPPVKPDLTVELEAPQRLDMLVELDVSGDPSTDHNVKKLRRLDALPVWARLHPRYRAHGEPPIAVFVVEDEPTMRKFLDRADVEMTGAISRKGDREADWAYPGRERTYFCCERDVHMGSLRAWQLPELPPEVRKTQHARPGARRRVEPRQVDLLEVRV